MTQKDLATITALGVLVAALTVVFQGFGIQIPNEWAAGVPIGAAVILTILRLYINIVGKDNTSVDETIEKAEEAIADLANKAKGN
jgi:hypothetical protein